jgi:hypothetical protein
MGGGLLYLLFQIIEGIGVKELREGNSQAVTQLLYRYNFWTLGFAVQYAFYGRLGNPAHITQSIGCDGALFT